MLPGPFFSPNTHHPQNTPFFNPAKSAIRNQKSAIHSPLTGQPKKSAK
jgi:hypothetical protein